MTRFRLCLGSVAIGILLLAGCSSKTEVESDLHIAGAPDWVNEGNQMLKDRDGRLFHGIGSAPEMGNLSLQKTTADDRARAELARIFSSYMNVVSNDYSAAAGDGDEQLSEQAVTRQIDSLTQLNLTGAKIIGRWRDEDTGTIWSLAELDIKQVKKTLNTAMEMSPALRDFLAKEGDSIFDRMTGAEQ